MPRPPIVKKAMTDAERQRRRRRRLKNERSDNLKAKARMKRQEEKLEHFIPAPPGIIYYKYVPVGRANGEIVKVPVPHVKPLACAQPDLDDDDILALLDELHGIARVRGLDLARVPKYPRELRDLEGSKSVACSAAALWFFGSSAKLPEMRRALSVGSNPTSSAISACVQHAIHSSNIRWFLDSLASLSMRDSQSRTVRSETERRFARRFFAASRSFSGVWDNEGCHIGPLGPRASLRRSSA